MPDLTSAALFERDGRVLVAHRRRAPFASQWTLPMTIVRETEAAEDALRRHTVEQFGAGLGGETFVETVYLVDPDDQHQYVANIFRIQATGPLRFDAEGDYDDARWLTPADIEQLWMPPDLRVPLLKILTEPESLHETDWSRAGEGVPLGERAGQAPALRDEAARSGEPAPDNQAGWDAISEAYQREFYGERYGERLMWSRRASEDDLHVLDEVRGRRALVLGCGGGQDVVALAKMGAIAIGVDYSPKQIAYAKKYAASLSVENASFVEGTVDDLTRFDDESFDLAVSIYTLDFVERVDAVIAEAARVLKPGGVLAIAVKHPFGAVVEGGPPYVVARSYWSDDKDQPWDWKDGPSVLLRNYLRTMSQWFELLTTAGFSLERLIEPKDDDLERGPDDELDTTWLGLMPYTLIMKARKR